MKNLRLLFLMIFIFISVLNATADVRLPAIIASHMVLQQNTTVKIWGWCDANEKIKINTGWDTTTFNTNGSSGGRWLLEIKTPAAGGPYTITINGKNKNPP